MPFCNRTKKSECCICLDKKEIVLSCKFCVEGVVCEECGLKIIEDARCPICRQENWRKGSMSKKKVAPCAIDYNLANIEAINEETDEDEELVRSMSCEDRILLLQRVWDNILLMLGLIVISTVSGFLTMYVFFSPDTFQTHPVWIWISAPIIGLIEIRLFYFCCCGMKPHTLD